MADGPAAKDFAFWRGGFYRQSQRNESAKRAPAWRRVWPPTPNSGSKERLPKVPSSELLVGVCE